MKLTGDDQLYFYDAIAPIVAADSVDQSIAFRAARYGKGGDDYLNCPFDEDAVRAFLSGLIEANSVPLQRFEETRWFEACLPIEELARRGVDTLRFGPMKPVGLVDPRTGREPYAAVQLRQENLMADAYSLVGFQNHLRYGEQARVLRLIPGLERAEFLQFGQIHRNTYINCAERAGGNHADASSVQTSSLPGRSPASKVMLNRWRWVGWQARMPRGSQPAKNF